jgi:acetyl-CoA synthetase
MADDDGKYASIYHSFKWKIPEVYNIGVDVCDRWAQHDPGRIALSQIGDDGTAVPVSYGALRDQSNQLANFLAAQNLSQGDRVAILLRQCPQTVVSHIATYKSGAIAIPLFTLFGTEALLHRLSDSAAKVVITDAAGLAKVRQIWSELPNLSLVICIDTEELRPPADGTAHPAQPIHGSVVNWDDALAGQSRTFAVPATKADDPALLIYTSGTTGLPKGALHAHRVLLGHLPGVEMSHDFLPQPGDKIWTPADWAWIGGLLDVLLPALHHGVPVVAKRFTKFTAEAAFDLLRDHNIRNAFLPPTALKLMRVVPDAAKRWNLSMRSVASGGEPLGLELLEWGRKVLGVTINEFYGQTECNMIVSSASSLMPAKPGVMGRPVPGHDVAILAKDGAPCGVGEQGDIAIKAPDPVMFLRYWNNEQATKDKFFGDWLITGDVGVRESGGGIRFVGRNDDVITSSAVIIDAFLLPLNSP